MIDNGKLEKVKAEIERRIALYSGLSEDIVNPNRVDEDRQILSFINSLEEEPIFHVGDVIRHKEENDSFKVLAIENDCYKLENNIVVSIAAQDSWELVEEPASEDLGDYINELSKQFPEVSFAKLSRIAVRVVKWKEKEMQSTIELAEDHAMLAGMVKGTEHTIGNVRSILNKVAYENNGLDVNGDYCEQPYVELDDEFKKLLKEE